jgi:cell division protein FtsB
MLKDFITKQTAFNKTIEEKFAKIDTLVAKVDNLAHDVDLLKLKDVPQEVKESNLFATANAIQVKLMEMLG